MTPCVVCAFAGASDVSWSPDSARHGGPSHAHRQDTPLAAPSSVSATTAIPRQADHSPTSVHNGHLFKLAQTWAGRSLGALGSREASKAHTGSWLQPLHHVRSRRPHILLGEEGTALPAGDAATLRHLQVLPRLREHWLACLGRIRLASAHRQSSAIVEWAAHGRDGADAATGASTRSGDAAHPLQRRHPLRPALAATGRAGGNIRGERMQVASGWHRRERGVGGAGGRRRSGGDRAAHRCACRWRHEALYPVHVPAWLGAPAAAALCRARP